MKGLVAVLATCIAIGSGYAHGQSKLRSGVWYFCDASRTYYPYVRTCAGPWREVPAESQNAQPLVAEHAPEPLTPQQTAPEPITPQPDATEDLAAKQQAEAAAEQAAIAAKAVEERQRDERAGYRYTNVADLDLDKATLPAGQKLVLFGFFETDGGIDWMVHAPFVANSPKVGLLEDQAPRYVRARLQQCRMASVCQITLYGQLVPCERTFMGSTVADDKCLQVWGMKGN